MTKEDKELLLKDLCAREPYHPRINVFNNGYEGFQDGEFDTNLWLHHIDAFRFDRIEIRPYLRSMPSMTEGEKKEYWDITSVSNHCAAIDWLNAHYFDYRGLISKGLAIEAPEGMYKIN